MKKTILASAVLMAFAGPVLAAQWEVPVLEFDGSNETEMVNAYTKFVYNYEGKPSGLTELQKERRAMSPLRI